MSKKKSEGEKVKTLISRGWTEEGARFMAEREFSLDLPSRFSLLEQEKRSCSRCGYTGVALDNHHVKGRKISRETVLLCANCHRETHAAEAKARKGSS